MRHNFATIAKQLRDRLLDTKLELEELTNEDTKVLIETNYAFTQLQRCESYLALCILTHKNATKAIAKLKEKHKIKS